MSEPTRGQLNDLVAYYGAGAFWGWATAGVLAGILAWRWARG
ncbi:hypothetical protein [Williamsia serinedens]|uniref:Heme exporter protein D n=1 Tax=Williamsia serinedens TaxID=391736 RepID=A0ABT1H7T5_9NOCA|nr:hypothetical protein [Williamsia serinedens]MCP2162678.1 hypothetical protein [Williamsia serinedens]